MYEKREKLEEKRDLKSKLPENIKDKQLNIFEVKELNFHRYTSQELEEINQNLIKCYTDAYEKS